HHRLRFAEVRRQTPVHEKRVEPPLGHRGPRIAYEKTLGGNEDWLLSRLALVFAPDVEGLSRAGKQQRPPQSADGIRIYDALLDVAARRNFIHYVEQALLQHGPQPAGAGLVPERFLGCGFERIIRKNKLDVVQREEFCELAGKRVLRLCQNLYQRRLIERLKRHHHRNATDELRYQAVR